MLRQMRLLYCRSNRLVRLFSKCSKTVLIELCRSICTMFYCPYFWTQYKKATLSKLRVAYNNIYRKIGLCRRSSASEMFVTNNILNFEALMRKSIFAVPCLPVLTWEMTHDHLPLRSEKLHKIGSERFYALLSIIFQIKIIQYLSLRLWRE